MFDSISLLCSSAFSAFSSSRANHNTIDRYKEPLEEKIEALSSAPLPRFDSTSFTEAKHLIELNRLREQEDFKFQKEQALLHSRQERISGMSNQALRCLLGYLKEEDPSLRELAAAELIRRRDPMAVIPFILCALEEGVEDLEVRLTCVIGLGELGNKDSLTALEMIKEDDRIYRYAQEAIRKIMESEISALAG